MGLADIVKKTFLCGGLGLFLLLSPSCFSEKSEIRKRVDENGNTLSSGGVKEILSIIKHDLTPKYPGKEIAVIYQCNNDCGIILYFRDKSGGYEVVDGDALGIVRKFYSAEMTTYGLKVIYDSDSLLRGKEKITMLISTGRDGKIRNGEVIKRENIP